MSGPSEIDELFLIKKKTTLIHRDGGVGIDMLFVADGRQYMRAFDKCISNPVPVTEIAKISYWGSFLLVLNEWDKRKCHYLRTE